MSIFEEYGAFKDPATETKQNQYPVGNVRLRPTAVIGEIRKN